MLPWVKTLIPVKNLTEELLQYSKPFLRVEKQINTSLYTLSVTETWGE